MRGRESGAERVETAADGVEDEFVFVAAERTSAVEVFGRIAFGAEFGCQEFDECGIGRSATLLLRLFGRLGFRLVARLEAEDHFTVGELDSLVEHLLRPDPNRVVAVEGLIDDHIFECFAVSGFAKDAIVVALVVSVIVHNGLFRLQY